MDYQLTGVTIRADNAPAGLARIGALWGDVLSGALPLLRDGERFPIARYSAYENGPDGAYDLSILSVTADFLHTLEEGAAAGRYQKYEARCPGGLHACAQAAWAQVWTDSDLRRAFDADYEVTIPAACAPDGQDCCVLYLSVR